MESMMLFVRREFLQLVGAIIMTSATSEPTVGAAGPSSAEILSRELVGQNHRIAETTVVFLLPGAVSTLRIHPRAMHLDCRELTREYRGKAAKSIGGSQIGLVRGEVVGKNSRGL
jgi:hypothetical protein